MKLKIILFILFFTFGVVQLNDPDPLLWACSYWYISFLILLRHFKKDSSWTYYLGGAFYVGYLGLLIPEFLNWLRLGMPSIVNEMSAKAPYVEFAREFFGLLICLTYIVVVLRQKKTSVS